MPDLTPMTREEKFLNGDTDLTPITRREHFYAGTESELPEPDPITREEWFIQKYRGGGGGDITVESLSVTENGTYTAPSGKAYSPVSVNVPLPQNAYLLKSVANLPQAIASFNDGQEMVMPSLKVAIEPQQEGSGDPSPTNIRPISGWSEANVTRTGKNLWGGEKLADDIVSKVPQATKDTTNKTVSYSAGYVSGKVLFDNFKPNTIYTIFMMTSSSANNVMVRYTDGTNTYINKDLITVTQANKSIECVIGIWSTGTTVLKYEECGIFEGVITAEDFVAYNGSIYTIDLDGTCYGGEVDVVNGIVTPAPYYASYNGETLTGEWISDRDKYEVGATPTIGAQVVNIGASGTPVSILPTAVKSLLGQNNIWADTGDITDAEYFSKEV